LHSISRSIDLFTMYPDKKRITLIAYGSLLFALQFIINIIYLSFAEIDFRNPEKQYELLGILLTVVLYPFLAWEYLFNKQWKFALLIALILTVLVFSDKFLMPFFYNDLHLFNKWFYYVKPFISVFSWCGLVYGFAKGGWKDGLGGFIIGVLFYCLLIKLQFGNITHFVFDKDGLIINLVFGITFISFTTTSLGFTYYYLLNYYTNRNKIVSSFTADYKKFTLQESLFYPSFILLYTVFISAIISLGNNKFMDSRFYFEGSKTVSVVYLILVVFVLFLILHSLSNLVIQKLYQLKISIGITYLFLFVPVVNIFLLIYLYRKEKSAKSNPNVSSTKNIERFENEDYKKLVIILNVIVYAVTLALSSSEYTKTGMAITIAFYAVNIAFLGGLYFYKYAGIGLFISLMFLTFFRFYFDIADAGLIIRSLVSGLMLIYLYTQSFHPISLEVVNSYPPLEEEETTPPEAE
jgi:hypothetical protein